MEFLLPREVILESYIWMAGENFPVQVLINVCLLPAVIKLCIRLDSFGITDLHAEIQIKGPVIMPIAGVFPNAVSEYQVFVNKINMLSSE